MRLPLLLAPMALLALPPARAAAGQGAVLLGTVVMDSTKQPLRGAAVEIPSLSKKVATDSLGRFRITGIPPGRRGLRVDLLGYQPLRTAIEFSAGDTVEMEIGISPSVEGLDVVEVVATQNGTQRLAEFERRRATRTGAYLTAQEISSRGRGRMSEVLRTLDGVSFHTTGSSAYLIGSRASTRGTTCYTAVMLDGTWMYDGDRWQTPFNVNSLNPDDIAAIEYYRGLSNTPVELQGIRNSCGVLVIWTK
ncbi:MAG: TonB-dependent receptor [Gemmatimonadaceae bacterium]|nr:TonB-dependent receptor [Gemmatimonadaceae bacterium]